MSIKKSITAAKIAAIALTAVFIISGCAPQEETASQSGQEVPSPEPLIYESGGVVYMTTGADTVPLPGAGELNGVFVDGSLYYITDTETGTGTLMRAEVDCKSAAAAVAENVCNAEVSRNGDILILRNIAEKAGDLYSLSAAGERLLASDVSYMDISENGARALFISGKAAGAGELYSWDMLGNPELIASGVSPGFLGFSPNAKNIYYVTKEGGKYALYVKLGSAQPIKVDDRRGGREGAECFAGAYFKGWPLSDNGQMVYFGDETIPGKDMYVYYSGSETEKYSAPCGLFNTFSDGSLLFMYHFGGFYYKEPGRQEKQISENFYLLPWYGCYLYPDMPQVFEKRFLFQEDYTDLTGPKVTLFEQEIGKEAVMLSEVDRNRFNINYDFTKVAYVTDGDMYIREKRKTLWSKPELVAEDIKISSLIGESRFDLSGKYLYYISEEQDSPISGSLYRYDIDEEKNELLLKGAHSIFLIDDMLYAVDSGGEAWALDGEKKKLADGITDILKAPEGVFLKGDIDDGAGLYWYDTESGKVNKLCEDAKWQNANGIKYRPPLTEEDRETLRKLLKDANTCLAALDAGEKLPDLSEDVQLAENLRQELSEKYSVSLDKLCSGFSFAQFALTTGSEADIEGLLNDAKEACEEILGTEEML